MNEHWREIIDRPGYKVSNIGRVLDTIKNKIVDIDKEGRVQLERGSRFKLALVGRLVLEAFISPCPVGRECCHKDDNRLNNMVDNLYWGTSRDNANDRVRNGRNFLPGHHEKGDDNSHSKLTEEQVIEAKMLRKENPKLWT